MTQLVINLPENKKEKVTISDLPDGTFFEFADDIYVKNTFKDADAYSLCGKYALSRGAYENEYPSRVFEKVEITLS